MLLAIEANENLFAPARTDMERTSGDVKVLCRKDWELRVVLDRRRDWRAYLPNFVMANESEKR